MGTDKSFLVRDSPTRFLPPVFFHHSNQPGPQINGFKYFLFELRFHWNIRNLVSKKVTRRGMIPWGDWLAGVSYPRESCFGGFFIDSPGHDTPGRLTCRVVIPRGDWLGGVWYPGEIDWLGYDTPGSQI